MCKPCVGAKLVLRVQALIAHAFLDRSIPFLFHKSACPSGYIFRKRISFISRLCAIVSYFVRGDFFLLALYCQILSIANSNMNYMTVWARASRSPSRRRLLLIPSGDQIIFFVANFILFYFLFFWSQGYFYRVE